MQVPVILLTLMLFSSNAYANCVTNERGRVVCSNGSDAAGGYNSRTGTAWKSTRNQNGVATTQTSRGGMAKTKNGKGVYQSPNGNKLLQDSQQPWLQLTYRAERDQIPGHRCSGARRKIGRNLPMSTQSTKLSVIIASLALTVACATELRAQISTLAGRRSAAAPSAAQALTGGQQSAANSALCSAIGSHFPNPAAAGPSALSDPAVMSTAASSFAGSTSLPLSSATDMLKSYVAQHATDILASCATSAERLTSKIPGAGSLPSVPNMP